MPGIYQQPQYPDTGPGPDPLGDLEVIATLLSGVGSQVPAGLGGALTLLATLDPAQAAGTVRKITEGLTYTPRTEGGMQGLQTVAESKPIQLLDKAQTFLGDVGYEAAGPIGGVLGELAPDFLDLLVGSHGAGLADNAILAGINARNVDLDNFHEFLGEFRHVQKEIGSDDVSSHPWTSSVGSVEPWDDYGLALHPLDQEVRWNIPDTNFEVIDPRGRFGVAELADKAGMHPSAHTRQVGYWWNDLEEKAILDFLKSDMDVGDAIDSSIAPTFIDGVRTLMKHDDFSDSDAIRRMRMLPEFRKNEMGLYGNRVFDHPELFANYPGAENINVIFAPDEKDYRGSWMNSIGTMELSPFAERTTVLHELQHAVQGVEGFVPGSSVGEEAFRLQNDPANHNMTTPEIMKQAYENYLNNAGEVEARMVPEWWKNPEQAGNSPLMYQAYSMLHPAAAQGSHSYIDPQLSMFNRYLEQIKAME